MSTEKPNDKSEAQNPVESSVLLDRVQRETTFISDAKPSGRLSRISVCLESGKQCARVALINLKRCCYLLRLNISVFVIKRSEDREYLIRKLRIRMRGLILRAILRARMLLLQLRMFHLELLMGLLEFKMILLEPRQFFLKVGHWHNRKGSNVLAHRSRATDTSHSTATQSRDSVQ